MIKTFHRELARTKKLQGKELELLKPQEDHNGGAGRSLDHAGGLTDFCDRLRL